ncbi:hypothetical protein [Maricaulis parjimensis]|uniref:hypothetical protein n=1 Tax=Maricaulis parjimensis TaxID=144023 RepID=UPI00193A5537|nr:hypothetical protein [Maricaulis parjimensis]
MNSGFEQYIPLALGGLGGVLVGMLIILVCGLSGVSRMADGTKLYSGSLFLEGLAGLRVNAGRIFALFLAISFLFALSTGITALTGIPLGIMDLFTSCGAVFLGHRFLLEKPFQETGHSLPERGFFSVVLRWIVGGIIALLMFAFLLLPYAIINALLVNSGAPTTLFDIGLGFLLGLGLTVISLVMTRFTFAFPAAALGRKTWFGTAVQESQGMSFGLAGALWSNALVMIVLTVVIMATLEILRSALNLPVGTSEWALQADDPAFMWEFLLVELPVILITTAYSLVAISIVSAAYRRAVIDPMRG